MNGETVITEQRAREVFEETFGPCLKGSIARENSDGTVSIAECYEVWFDPYRERSVVRNFGIRALNAGYTKFETVLMPVTDVFVRDSQGNQRPQYLAMVFLERPAPYDFTIGHRIGEEESMN